MEHLHSGLRWIVLIGLLVTVISSLIGMASSKEFSDKNRKLSLIAFISSHIQLLVGIYLFLVSPKVSLENMMTSTSYRFYSLEHPIMMVLAILLITLGYMKAKRGTVSKQRFKTLAVYYGVALILILAAIPWPFREALGGSWG